MTSSPPSLNDIIFENRNKQYGAYLLRQLYENHIRLALCLTLTLFTLAVGFPYLIEQIKGREDVPEEIIPVMPTMIEPPPIDPRIPPPPPLPQTPPPPRVSTLKFVPPEVVPDEEVTEDPPRQEELKTVQAGTETIEGDPTADPNELSLDANGTGEVIGETPPPDEPFLIVDQMPEFPGGDLQAYFSKNLRYPQKAVKAEISGKVHVSFVIMPDGSVTQIQVMKGLGYGLDEEAIRVLSNMPMWNPGKQGGRAVKVKINLPIKFTL